MARKTILRPMDNKHRVKSKGQWTIRRIGEDFAMKGGDYDEFKHSFDIEETEVFSNEYPEKTLALVDITKADVTGGFTSRMLTSTIMAIATLSEEGELTQEAAADLTKTVSCPVDSVIRLGKRDVTVEAVKSGSVVYAVNDNYAVDEESGSVEILKHPAGVVLTNGKAPVTVEYSAAQITARRRWSLASMTDQRFELVFIQNSKWGQIQTETVFHNVQIRPDGDFIYGNDGDDFSTFACTFRCFADPVTGELATVVERVLEAA